MLFLAPNPSRTRENVRGSPSPPCMTYSTTWATMPTPSPPPVGRGPPPLPLGLVAGSVGSSHRTNPRPFTSAENRGGRCGSCFRSSSMPAHSSGCSSASRAMMPGCRRSTPFSTSVKPWSAISSSVMLPSCTTAPARSARRPRSTGLVRRRVALAAPQAQPAPETGQREQTTRPPTPSTIQHSRSSSVRSQHVAPRRRRRTWRTPWPRPPRCPPCAVARRLARSARDAVASLPGLPSSPSGSGSTQPRTWLATCSRIPRTSTA